MNKDIYAALNAVMQEVGYVQKKRTAGLNYTFAGEAALIAAIRPELEAQGVVVHPGQVIELRMSTAKPLAVPSAVKPGISLDGKVEDPRAWLKEKVQNDTVNFGFVADAAVMTGHYNDREHVRNALSGYEIAPGTKLDNPDFRIKVTAAGGFKVFDWLMSRKEVDDVA